MAQVLETIQSFIESLPPTTMIIILFDSVDHVIGFAAIDPTDKSRAKIYNLSCKKIHDVVVNTTLRDIVDVLLKDQCR